MFHNREKKCDMIFLKLKIFPFYIIILKNCIIKNKFQIMMKNNGSQIDLKLFETFFYFF